MAISDILKTQSQWTWDIMQWTSEIGEIIREDGITSANLGTINHIAKQGGLNISITSFQGGNLEKEYGADWFWSSGDLKYIVQAKRLDVVKSIGSLSYLIDINQLNTLIQSAGRLQAKAIYVLYNSFIQGANPVDVGCTSISADTLYGYLISKGKQEQATATIGYDEVVKTLSPVPWYTLFT